MLFRSIGRDLPLAIPGQIAVPLEVTVALSIEAPSVAIGGVNVVARIPGRLPNGPLIVVAAPYDAAPSVHYLDYASARPQATATAALVAAAESVRGAGLNADLIWVAVGSQVHDAAGLKAALRDLSGDEAKRLIAFIWIPSALGSPISLQADPTEAQNPAGSGRVAGRVANALGARSVRQGSAELPRTLAAVGVRAATFQIAGSATEDTPVNEDALRTTGRAVLTLIAYLAEHPETLK